MKFAVAGAVLCAISFPHLVAAAEVPLYQYVDLGDARPGFPYLLANRINNAGTVAGQFAHPEGGTASFQYSNGQLTALTLPFAFSSTSDLNERGEITGHMSADRFFGTYRSFYFSSSRGALDLGQLSAGGNVAAMAINGSGFITGRAELAPGGTWHAFLWDPSTGVMKNLGSPNGSYSEGMAINASGMVAANVTSKTTRNAFVYDKGVSTIIAPGKVSSVGPRSITDDGYVTGSYEVAAGRRHAFRWYKGQLTDLGTLGGGLNSSSFAINASHMVVGGSDTAADGRHVFLYDGKMKDITALAKAAGVSLVVLGMQVEDINSLGYLALTPGSFNIKATSAMVYKKGRFEGLTPDILSKPEEVGAARAVSINDVGQVTGLYQDYTRVFIATPISLLFQRLWDAVINFPTLRTSEGAAWTAYANYDVKTSDTQLAKFITAVNTLVAQKKLSATLGNKWVADAQAIRAAMKG